MKHSLLKYASLALCGFISLTALAESQFLQCPALHGTYHNDQAVEQSAGDWYFWTDRDSETVNINKWSGQNVRIRQGKFYNFGLVCSAGSNDKYYGVFMPVKATNCAVFGNGKFVCKSK